MRRKLIGIAIAAAMLLAPATAWAHGALNHHSCASNALHGIQADSYWWGHTLGQTSSIWSWLGADFDYVYYHYEWRPGIGWQYKHYNRVTCW